MPIDTVISVQPRKDRTPGRIKMSAAGELSTYSDAALETAAKAIGQRVDYTLEDEARPNPKGGFFPKKITELKIVAGEIPTPAGAVMYDQAPLVAQAKRIADAIERVIALLAGGVVPNIGAGVGETPAPAPIAVDPFAAKQERLAAKIGQDSAKALVEVIKSNFAGDDDKAHQALDGVLKAHGA